MSEMTDIMEDVLKRRSLLEVKEEVYKSARNIGMTPNKLRANFMLAMLKEGDLSEDHYDLALGFLVGSTIMHAVDCTLVDAIERKRYSNFFKKK